MSTYYTTGSDQIADCCGHKHRTMQTALDCLAQHQTGCHAQGGYSRRDVQRVTDGAPVDLSVADMRAGAIWGLDKDYQRGALDHSEYLAELDEIDARFARMGRAGY